MPSENLFSSLTMNKAIRSLEDLILLLLLLLGQFGLHQQYLKFKMYTSRLARSESLHITFFCFEASSSPGKGNGTSV